MAAGLTLTLSIAAVTLPGAMQNAGDATGLLAGAGAGFLLTLVYTCSYLHQITVNAARPAGESISLNPILAARTGGGWAAAVLSGPVLPAAGSYLYWLRIGLKDAVDWIILAELIWLTVFWLTAALLSVAIDSDWKSALPHRALRKARLIPKSIAIHSAVSAVLCAGTVFGITHSLVTIHTDGFSGIVCMGGTFLTCLLASAALARSLGRTGTSILPEDTAEVDAGIQAFEQELQSSQI